MKLYTKKFYIPAEFNFLKSALKDALLDRFSMSWNYFNGNKES